jgi:hypothetical protein
MQALVQAAAAGGCLLVAVLLSKVLPFLVRCVQARRQYLSSPIPGPPVAMGIMGEYTLTRMWQQMPHLMISLHEPSAHVWHDAQGQQ